MNVLIPGYVYCLVAVDVLVARYSAVFIDIADSDMDATTESLRVTKEPDFKILFVLLFRTAKYDLLFDFSF